MVIPSQIIRGNIWHSVLHSHWQSAGEERKAGTRNILLRSKINDCTVVISKELGKNGVSRVRAVYYSFIFRRDTAARYSCYK